jgi:hypothetical protein
MPSVCFGQLSPPDLDLLSRRKHPSLPLPCLKTKRQGPKKARPCLLLQSVWTVRAAHHQLRRQLPPRPLAQAHRPRPSVRQLQRHPSLKQVQPLAPALEAHLGSLLHLVHLALRKQELHLALLPTQEMHLAPRKQVDSGAALAAAALVPPSPAGLLGLQLEELLGPGRRPSVHQLGGLGRVRLAVRSAQQPVVPLVRRGEACLARRNRVDLGAPLAAAVLALASPAWCLLGLPLEQLLGRRLAPSGRRRQQAPSGRRRALGALARRGRARTRAP